MRVSYHWIGLLCLLVSGLPLAGGPVSAAPARQPAMGAIVTMDLDNQGNGWAWTADPSPDVNGHLLRLENGAWRELTQADPGAAPLLRQTVALYKLTITGKGDSGWAIGSGGGQRIWRLQNNAWSLVPNPLPAGSTLDDVGVSADGASGWLLASGPQAEGLLLQLRDGAWATAPTPNGVDLRSIALSPDGQSGWGAGFQATTRETVVVRWAAGRWQDTPVPVATNVRVYTADNAGNGWALGPPIRSTLVRLSANAPPREITVQPTVSQGTLAGVIFHAAAVDGLGRGWVTGVARVADAPPGQGALLRPLLLRVNGESVSEAPLAGISSPREPEEPPYLGPPAVSPGGGYGWLAASVGQRFVALTQLLEPWPHPQPPAAPAPLPGAARCFAEVPYCLRGPLARYWEANGGLEQFGFPITPEVQEKQGDKTYVVQYTERSRFEYHPENAPPFDVLLGLLGNALADPRAGEVPFQPRPASTLPGSQWFPETQHNVGPPLLAYWRDHGGLPVFGLPRSEAFDERNAADGKVYRVQYFERNRLEYHPEHAGTRFEFLLGLLGVEQFSKTYGYTP